MRSTKSKNKNMQNPLIQGRAAEITPLLDSFFDTLSFDEVESLLSTLLQEYIDPHFNGDHSGIHIANTVFGIREINNLLRKLEVINNQLKGGLSC